MKTTILFDYGGTLDTAARHWSYVLHEGFSKSGVTLTQESFRKAYVTAERALAKYPYITNNDNFHALLYKKVEIEVESLIQENVWKPKTYKEQVELVGNVANYCDNYARYHVKQSEQTLCKLAQRYKLVIVSNFYGNLATILFNYGIAPYFDSLIESAKVGVRKPSPIIWEMGANAMGAKLSECVAVGDSFTKDILPARQIGCETVWFSGEEWETQQRDETIPTHIIHSLSELLKYY